MNIPTLMPLEVPGIIKEWTRRYEHPLSTTQCYGSPSLLLAADQTVNAGGGAS